MSLLEATCARIREPDTRIAVEMQRLLDDKTKPRGSLGRLEELACQVAAIRGEPSAAEPPRKAVVVMGADHGVAEESVSAYPQEVTAQMLLNFARGGAAINVLARQAGARVVVVDMGVKSELPALPEIRSRRIGRRHAQLHARAGDVARRGDAARSRPASRIAEELAADGITLLGIGDMGIGNTTASSALTAAFTGAPPGRGRGPRHRARRRRRCTARSRWSGARWRCTAPTRPTPSARWRSSAASRSRGSPAWCWARSPRASRWSSTASSAAPPR